jgi:hypothetical protein
MGRSYFFECARCGYKAKISGGADRGFNFHVQTVLCRDCKALYDAVVRLRISDTPGSTGISCFPGAALRKQITGGAPAFESVLKRLLYVEGRQLRWTQFSVRCPVSATHKVRLWNEPDKCPKCGIYLEKSALPFRIWE